MPSTVADLLSKANLILAGRSGWGQQIRDDRPGVYIVSTSTLPTGNSDCCHTNAPIDPNILNKWIAEVSTLRLNGCRPTISALQDHLSGFWLPDESILYIGKAGTSVKKRVGQYYRTPLGAPKPHAGGHWIKTLSILSSLSVFWSLTDTPEDKENELLGYFVQNVSEQTKRRLLDPDNPFPFANLEYPKGNCKNHACSGSVNRG